MKKAMIFAMLLATVALMAGCKSKSAKETSPKTIENLKAGITGETTASAKYAAFAQKATEEGLMPIAQLFKAASKAESIHADNHLKVLEKLGEKMDPIDPKFEVKTTKENLQAAINGESYEFSTMYPGFIQTAKDENVEDAVKSFTWALDTEKKHKDFYQKALDAINNGVVASLPTSFFVCPKCGNTYDAATVTPKCDFCKTPKEKYIAI